jgi:predicted 3-demethylubiquinone-9 3-methyltransferase (glyoxalase superfamily)
MQAEEAAKFYVSVFKNSKIVSVNHYDENSAKAANMPKGSVLIVAFTLNGQEFMALNGGPAFKLSEAISFIIPCKDQQEIDYYWNHLSKGGEESVCGWLKDKFGLSWQVVPEQLDEWMKDPKKQARVMKEVLKMTKLDFKKLEAAAKEA